MENKDIKILIVPDVHGREFWVEPVMENPDKEIIFLGDYLDPYPHEGITPEHSIDVFGRILALRKDNPNITLLLGNHDAGYVLGSRICDCRHDWNNHKHISQLFADNYDFFDLAKEKVVNKKHFFFSHAGINPSWIENDVFIFGRDFKPTAKKFNDLLHNTSDTRTFRSFIAALADVSTYRGGWESYGSMLWADVREFYGRDLPSKKIQVVGHTMVKVPVVLNNRRFYCLDDTKDVFYIDSEGIIKYYNTDEEV